MIRNHLTGGFRPFIMFAGSGNITGSGSNSALIATVAPSSPATGTLGAIGVQALQEHPAEAILVVDFKARKIVVADASAPNRNDIDAALIAAGLQPCNLTKTEPESASSAWLFDDTNLVGQEEAPAGVALVAALGAVPPRLSVASLISKIEDNLPAGFSGVVVVDQETEIVNLYLGLTAEVEAANIAGVAGIEKQATFTQSIVTASGRQFGE